MNNCQVTREKVTTENFYTIITFPPPHLFSCTFIQQGVQAKLKDESNDDAKQKKSIPVYYVNSKVNGRFGKNMRAFSIDEFLARYPVKY